MVAQYAQAGVTIAAATVFGAGLVAAFLLRAWKTPVGQYSERHHTKLYALAVATFALFTPGLMSAMGDHSFGHLLLGSHQINVGIYTAWLFAAPAFAIFLGLSFSEVEHYSYLAGVFQAAVSALLLVGARSSDVADVGLTTCVLGFFLQLVAMAYGYFWCVPAVEWQQQRGSNKYLIIKALLYIPFIYFPIAFTVDNTYQNVFHDDENKMAIMSLVITAVHMVAGGLYVLWAIDVLPTPPVFQVGQGLSGGVGMITRGGAAAPQYVQVQTLEQTGAQQPAAPAQAAPATQTAQFQLRW